MLLEPSRMVVEGLQLIERMIIDGDDDYDDDDEEGASNGSQKDDDLIIKPSPELIEFDGTTVLCRVCGDKASGFHYGVHSCEGCKGFFRRSIQQKIQYRPCTKNQQCSILRINRNRCQYCRLKKCIAVGMSRDAVRFGRVPKREKAKILAAMQKVNATSQEKALSVELEDEMRLFEYVVRAHEETCDFTSEKIAPMIEQARAHPIYAQCTSQLACPLNPTAHQTPDGSSRIMEDFSERFSPAIRGVVEFAKRIPGFGLLPQEDQVTLLKAGVFEVLLVRLARMFDSLTNTMICLNGQVLRREALNSASNARFLFDSMFDFAERLNALRLSDAQLAIFCAVVVIAADRPGLRNVELVQKIQRRLMDVLQKAVVQSPLQDQQPSSTTVFGELMKKIPDLRTLNTLHSEKLLAYKMEPQSTTPPYTAESWSSSPMHHRNVNGNMHADQWSPVASPHSSTNSMDGCPMNKSPIRSGSFSSTDYSLADSPNGINAAKHCGVVTSVNSSGVKLVRRVDSPTDSGIESGKEQNGCSTPTTSVCSSPRSLKDAEDSEVHPSAVASSPEDDMPVLKRALQAPPLVSPNQLMEEAYRHHKKLRAAVRNPPPPSAIPDNLAASHSTLVGRLQQAPRFMSEQQIKRTDLIHNIIMRNETPASSTGLAPPPVKPAVFVPSVSPLPSPFAGTPPPHWSTPTQCPYSRRQPSPVTSSSPLLVNAPSPLHLQLPSAGSVSATASNQPLNLSTKSPTLLKMES